MGGSESKEEESWTPEQLKSLKTELEVDFDLILPKLFLGTHRAAKSHAFHKRLKIAAVLNVK
jgi:hypothetical protein